MNSHFNDPRPGCIHEVVLEDYAMGKSSEDTRNAIEDHLDECRECSENMNRIRETSILLAETLRAATPNPEGNCPGEEQLALFLDRALELEDRQDVESHLSMCRNCQSVLVAIYRELKAVTGEGTPHEEVILADFSKESQKPASGASLKNVSSETTARPSLASSPYTRPAILISGLISLVAVGSTFWVTGKYQAYLQMVSLACAAFLGYCWLMERLKNAGHTQPRPQTGLQGALLAVSAISFTLAGFRPQATTGLLTVSFLAYLCWIFGRLSRSLPLSNQSARQSQSGAPSRKEEREDPKSRTGSL